MRELREDFSKTHSVEEARLKAEQTYRETEEALQTEVSGVAYEPLLHSAPVTAISLSLVLFLSLSLPPFSSFSLFLFLPSPLSLSFSSSLLLFLSPSLPPFSSPPPPLFLQMAASLEAKRKELQSQHKEELVRKQLQDVKQCLHASYSTGGRESYCSCPTVFMLGWWRSAPTQDYVDAYLNFVL